MKTLCCKPIFNALWQLVDYGYFAAWSELKYYALIFLAKPNYAILEVVLPLYVLFPAFVIRLAHPELTVFRWPLINF